MATISSALSHISTESDISSVIDTASILALYDGHTSQIPITDISELHPYYAYISGYAYDPDVKSSSYDISSLIELLQSSDALADAIHTNSIKIGDTITVSINNNEYTARLSAFDIDSDTENPELIFITDELYPTELDATYDLSSSDSEFVPYLYSSMYNIVSGMSFTGDSTSLTEYLVNRSDCMEVVDPSTGTATSSTLVELGNFWILSENEIFEDDPLGGLYSISNGSFSIYSYGSYRAVSKYVLGDSTQTIQPMILRTSVEGDAYFIVANGYGGVDLSATSGYIPICFALMSVSG